MAPAPLRVLALHVPHDRLRDDHALPVEGHGRPLVQPVPRLERLADPPAEGGVVGAGQYAVDGQSVGWIRHAAQRVTGRRGPPAEESGRPADGRWRWCRRPRPG
ncbi:hypothetical protein DJ64_03485 [Streptomyces griseorubens]|uniref:Uncharacterized protein n=1 Tax=Streptomyces griseorubens TaxID=66897 RepID=A0ABR4T3B7_9ACTN|nr:hypothetical protein DJ64_03485 [Streptomyces griseorubens]